MFLCDRLYRLPEENHYTCNSLHNFIKYAKPYLNISITEKISDR